jgi:hypothetical protein
VKFGTIGFMLSATPVTTTWRVLRLRSENNLQAWRAAANVLKKQSLTADKGWSYSFALGGGYQISTVKNSMLRNVTQPSNMAGCCKCGDEHTCSIKREIFLDYLGVLLASEGCLCSVEAVWSETYGLVTW